MIKVFINNSEMKLTSTISGTNHNDDSIIDVTGKYFKINPTSSNFNLRKYSNGVPHWAHQYVYSYNEINNVTNEQRVFYEYFKQSFLCGDYIDLEGNLNYAFILLFDLLKDYENLGDIAILEKQLQDLGQNYPKTKSYGITFLIQKMEAKGDIEGINRLKSQENYNYQYDYVDYDYWKLGNKYKSKLDLKDNEVKLLNNLYNTSNNFCSIEYCLLEVIKHYLATIEELNRIYMQEGTTLEQEFSVVADLVAKKHFRYRQGSYNYIYCIQSTTNDIHSIIFKHCENAVRGFYGHKRKLNTEIYYIAHEIKTEYETRIISKLNYILPLLISRINPLDVATDIELNSYNTNRWKIKFENITKNFNNNSQQFIDDIISLANSNIKNPSIENIFFDASKFISKSSKGAALTLYIYYLYHDLKSANFDNKQLTKTIQKNLFNNNEQLRNFEIVVSELVKDKNLEKALHGVASIYEVKRKKIELDTNSIRKVQKQHSGTVQILNEYLKDEYEDEINTIKVQEINKEEVKIEITQKTEKALNSPFIGGLSFTKIHDATLEIFVKNNFSVPQDELEGFAKSKGVFINQLIESINEICYENLDDVLIEDDEEYYTINQYYYQKLLTK